MGELNTKIKGMRIQPVGLVEQVSRALADAILEGLLKGGDQLIEAELQKQFAISRSPLREAFRDLEKQGLVIIVPRKGTFVKNITRKDVEDYYPVHAVLEGLAARQAHGRLTDEDLDEMEQELENMARAAEKKDSKAHVEHHRLFHSIFTNASGNEILINLIQNLRLQGTRYRYFYRRTDEYYAESLDIHRQILDLFRDKSADPGEVEKLVRRHVEIFADRPEWEL